MADDPPPFAPRRNPSLVHFLRAWMNEPIPPHVLEIGGDIIREPGFTPEQHAAEVVKRCVIAWMEADHAKG